ncbi:Caffeoyl-CoA O-methyltransferase [Spatholobus suberectus]|nr:Caffeoyl-CoA O-methyltransferase [Spatholobus suberectus]
MDTSFDHVCSANRHKQQPHQAPMHQNYYIFETSGYPKKHEQLKQLRETTVQKYGNKSVMNVPVDEAQFISILLKVMKAKKTLEIGVFTDNRLMSIEKRTKLDCPSFKRQEWSTKLTLSKRMHYQLSMI